jgi:hypothetical protein
MRDFRSLDRKVACAKCGRKLPYYELEEGFCKRCWILEKPIREEKALLRRRLEEQSREEKELLRRKLDERISKEGKLFLETAKKNDSLKSIPCPFCGRFSLSYSAHYVRIEEPSSYVVESYECSNWRCKAKGESLSSMRQRIGVFIKILNKIAPFR